MAYQSMLLSGVSNVITNTLYNDDEKIERFLNTREITQCPPAYAEVVNGAVELGPLPHYERKKGRFF